MKNMFKYYYKLFFLLLFCSSILWNQLNSQEIGDIYSLEFPSDNKIYFGPLQANDTTIMHFVIKSFVPTDTLMIDDRPPTCILSNPPWINDPNSSGYMLFGRGTIPLQPGEDCINNFPMLFHKNIKMEDTMKVQFSTLSSDQVGRKEAMLAIGLAHYKEKEKVLKSDTFYIIGKRTDLSIDWYDEFLDFDSVFINQNTPIKMSMKARNTTKQILYAKNEQYTLISIPHTNPEFLIDDIKSYPLAFYTGNNKVFQEWDFSYNPKDTIRDTAEIRLLFDPSPTGSSNKLDTAKLKLYGTGVTQYFEITNCEECTITEDTIDVGQIMVGQNKTITTILRNRGNISYSVRKQDILAESSDESIDYLTLVHPFCNSNNSLHDNDLDSFKIKCHPNEKGNFIARYVVENDFSDRKIKSNNPNDYKKTFIIKGTGIMPILKPEITELHFGNVNYSADLNCPTTKDTTITIFNTGNTTLKISDISVDNIAAFQVTPTDLSINANSSATITITFRSKAPVQLYSSKLTFKSNEIGSSKTTISLTGNSIPPMNAVMSIPQLQAKPGTLLQVPIYLTNMTDEASSIAEYISSYNFVISYNPNLLFYDNKITLGTASAGNIVNVDTSESGLLKISANSSSTLASSNILLILTFRTFLGDRPETEIAISEAKFGINEVCDNYINLVTNDGSYSIDSVCGLGYKLNFVPGSYSFAVANQTVNDELSLSFTLPFDNEVMLEVYNAIGDILKQYTYTLPKGDYTKNIDLAGSGVLYVVFRAGLYSKIIPFVARP